MTLHPIAVVNKVIEEYRSYLKTEFRARDPRLRQALEDALDQPRFLAQEPFFQAHRPFKEGTRWDELPLDAKLARAMVARSRSGRAWLHQAQAITRLLGPDPGPLVVTTGTGSGKTECFLLPVIQNAIEDSVRFKRGGLTALLIYPMNALANDQEERIKELLAASGHTHVRIGRYDRSTKEDDRDRWRQEPPHILLTNYMMLEYLMVRAADRDRLFANHRCRFIVLDEVHSYRGTLGSNIALLMRRLYSHLQRARQDWSADDRGDLKRFPTPITVATSATIKSIEEGEKSPEELRRLRDAAVQDFLAKLTGIEGEQFLVIGEEIQDLVTPTGARWPVAPAAIGAPDPHDPAQVAAALATLAADATGADQVKLAERAAILWTLNELLARKPMAVSGIVEEILAKIAERSGADRQAVEREVLAALVTGAALPDGIGGALRLRTHRFIRGGWRFHRCVDPDCGKLYPMGEEHCVCGRSTAPLYICRNCGADTLRFKEQADAGPTGAALQPNDSRAREGEWLLYDRSRFAEAGGEDEEDVGLVGIERQMRGRQVLTGSFDPATRSFSADEAVYRQRVALAPARTRCLVCGGTAGSRDVLTPVSLGTSAAVRVIAEGLVEGLADENREKPGHDGKERLLIFADSRQDAAHQARFITYAGRYDRMRRRLVAILANAGKPLTIDDAVRALVARGVAEHDNPHTQGYDDAEFLGRAVQDRARSWEEAPLLDDLAITAGYRASVLNLGLIGARYQHLDAYIERSGEGLALRLGISKAQLRHLCHCLLDEIRRRGALSRPMLQYHPSNPSCPDEFKDAADWERRIKHTSGYACDDRGAAVLFLDRAEIPEGVRNSNPSRRAGAGGRGPSLERKLRHLLRRMGGIDPTEDDDMLAVLEFLSGGPRFILPQRLHGIRQARMMLQVNADNVLLKLLTPAERFRCSVCNERIPWCGDGSPCPACHGVMQPWPVADIDANRYVQRIKKTGFLDLVCGEHTAQITGDARITLEENFKGGPEVSPVNVLACSPTLEMGIDVGGLDAVVMRNVPPRPDNYAQRGGRAGRRSRVGVVLGYARSTPHDGYFFDKPVEMIAGEVPVPPVSLGNRNAVRRHLNAIVFGLADPPLAGRMAEYLTLQGDLKEAEIDVLIAGLSAHLHAAASIAWQSWNSELLAEAGFQSEQDLVDELNGLPDRVRDLFDRIRLQLLRLQETIQRWTDLGIGDRGAVHAMALKRKLLGIPAENRIARGEADDRGSGHPMRRFAEFGILPGYEFPNEPCTLRLFGDRDEDQPIAVERRFGITQYQPDARVHARSHRWRVVGLDPASPWNPKSPEPNWIYVRCRDCELRYGAQDHARCPRCGSPETAGHELPGHEFGVFVAIRDDTPVLEEEDRFSLASQMTCHPQWNGRVIGRFQLQNAWQLELRRGEEVRWINEGPSPSENERQNPQLVLTEGSRGFYMAPRCFKWVT